MTILLNEVTTWWNEVTKGWNEVVWNEVVMERSDRIPMVRVRHSNKNVAQIVSLKRKLRVRWIREKYCVLPSRAPNHSSGPQRFFFLKSYLDMSWVQ